MKEQRVVTIYVEHPGLVPNMAGASKPGPNPQWIRGAMWKLANGRWYWMVTKNGIDGIPTHDGVCGKSGQAARALADVLCGPSSLIRYA